jgi:excisionase family DNA binding protein
VTVVQLRQELPDEWMTRAELATRYKVHERTIDRWVKQGMPAEKWGRRMVRFSLIEVENWLRGRAA